MTATTSIHMVDPGQTRLTNSQEAKHRKWLARCSPHAAGFSREQSTWNLTMGGTPFCFHGGSLAVWYLSWLPTHPTPLCQWTHLQQNNHYSSSTICQYTPASPFSQPQFPSFCKRQLTLPRITLWSPSAIISTLHFCENKWKLIRHLRGFEPGLPRWDFEVKTTLP